MNIQIDSDALNKRPVGAGDRGPDPGRRDRIRQRRAQRRRRWKPQRRQDSRDRACEKNARGAFRRAGDRIGQEEAEDRDRYLFGADPRLHDLAQPVAPAPTAQEIAELREKWQIITATWA